MKRLALIVAIIALATAAHADPGRGLETGYGEYDYFDSPSGKNLRVYYYKPSGYTPDSPVFFALHGDNRTAFAYRLEWKQYAEKLGFMLLVPHFSEDEFPGTNGFQFGGIAGEGRTAEGRIGVNAEETWVFSLVERLFSDFGTREETRRERYTIYGHSAGAQFVHRMALFQKNPHIEFAIAANAGWYIAPDPAVDWPFGLGGLGNTIGDRNIDSFLSFPLVVALGDADLYDDHKLNTSAEAMLQGPNRFERGNWYFEYCQKLAKARGVNFGWTKILVPGVGHSDAGMAKALAEYLATRWNIRK